MAEIRQEAAGFREDQKLPFPRDQAVSLILALGTDHRRILKQCGKQGKENKSE
jgi:hypothetical protein